MKILINEVRLGKKSVGFEVYNTDTQDMTGMTAKMIKDSIEAGKAISGFKLDDKNELEIDRGFCKNILVKSGISTYQPKWGDECIVNLVYTVVGKTGNEYEVVSSRFFHGMMPEDKVKTLYELGAVNGISIDSKGKMQVYEVAPVVALDEMSASEVV